jgi:cyclase
MSATYTKNRLIAVLLVYNGHVVQTRRFKSINMVGSAFTAVDFFNGWTVDEIGVLEISDSDDYLDKFVGIVEELSRRCFVPLSVGGKIRSIETAQLYMRAGADKLVVNTASYADPVLIGVLAQAFGSQAVVASIDARPDPAFSSGYEAMSRRARDATGWDAVEWAREVARRGAGEIMVNHVEHDGDKRGYDLNLVRKFADSVRVPIIAMGGVGDWDHLVDGVRIGGADAVAAGNIFHYTEHSTKKAKDHLRNAGVLVRNSTFYKIAMPRRPKYKPF